MPRGLKVSCPLIANTTSFVNISNFFKWRNIYIMTLGVAHWDTLDDRLAFWYAKGKSFFQHTNGKCHVFTF